MSESGNDSNPCTQLKPCRDINRAISLAQPGQTISVANGTYSAIRIVGKAGAEGRPITIVAPDRNAVIKHNDNPSSSTYGISIWMDQSKHIVLDGLKSLDATDLGMKIVRSDYITVKNCEVGYAGRMGIITGGVSTNITLINNVTHHSKSSHGLYLSESGNNYVVRGHQSYNNGKSGIQVNAEAGSSDSSRTSAVGIATNVLLENNTVYNNSNGGIHLMGVQNSIVRNNLLYNNLGTGIPVAKEAASQGSVAVKIYNNTIVMPVGGRYAIQLKGTKGTNEVKNNIIYQQDTTKGIFDFGTPTDQQNTASDYNVFGGQTRSALYDWTQFISLTSWQQGGKDTHTITAATLQSLFANASTNDYHLSSTSVAKDRGANLGDVTNDWEGDARPMGAAKDIGVDEAR